LAYLCFKPSFFLKFFPGKGGRLLSRESTIWRQVRWAKGQKANCRLHPLIHTFLEITLAQDIESKKSGASVTPHFLG
jgi:hypothetical protein